MDIQLVPSPFVEKTLPSPLNCLGMFAKNQLNKDTFISEFWILFHQFICLCHTTVLSSVIGFDIGNYESSLFLFKIVSAFGRVPYNSI